MVNYACAFNQSELGKYFEWIIKDVNFGTWLSVDVIEGVHLIGGPLNRGLTVVKLIYVFKNDLPDQ